MEPTLDTQDLVIAPDVRETSSEDGAVLLDIKQGICFSLNPVGLKIWTLLKTHHSIGEIVDELARDFSIPRAQLTSDTLEFVRALEEKRLVRRSGQNGPKKPWLARHLPIFWRKERA